MKRNVRILRVQSTHLDIEYLVEGIRPQELRIAAIKNFKLPENKKELQSYLRLVNYCRKFIKGFQLWQNLCLIC